MSGGQGHPEPNGRDSQPQRILRNARIGVAILFVLSIAFAVWEIAAPAHDPSFQEARNEFMLAVIQNASRTSLKLDAGNTIEVGQRAVEEYAKTATSGSPPGGPANPPGAGDRAWDFQSPCKLEIKKTVQIAKGQVAPRDLNVCIVPIYACVGTAYLKCPGNRDMKCIKWALDQGCEFSSGSY